MPSECVMADFIYSFSAVQRDMLIPALVLAFVPVIASLFTRNFQLTRVQNMVEAKAVTGESVEGVKQHPELIKEKVGQHEDTV